MHVSNTNINSTWPQYVLQASTPLPLGQSKPEATIARNQVPKCLSVLSNDCILCLTFDFIKIPLPWPTLYAGLCT